MDEQKKMTILMTSDEYTKAISILRLAIKGVSMGLVVNIFFMSCGMKVIKKNAKLHLHGLLRPFTFIAINRYKKAGIYGLHELIKNALERGVNFYGCKTCISIVGIKEEQFFDDVKFVGIEKYIELALASDLHFVYN